MQFHQVGEDVSLVQNGIYVVNGNPQGDATLAICLEYADGDRDIHAAKLGKTRLEVRAGGNLTRAAIGFVSNGDGSVPNLTYELG